ncbi:MAG: hypothetical protein CVU64_04470 [Deltaproteobacteria bacterium HGW-Deltaproteobacteria-21]|nr:MAG: hypothetical protein CVU64_04470 [Deltaproteobacteria bacterium HGW-Deltaproteobacteria-21]
MILSFHPVIIADVQIILGDRSLSGDDLSLIHDAKAIILPQSCSRELYRTCRESSARLYPNYDVRYAYEGKIGQSLLFHERGWPHPATTRWSSVEAFVLHEAQGVLPHRPPFFLKRNMCHEGDGVYLIQGSSDLQIALEDIRRKGDSGFISQDLVPTEGNVLRTVILGRRIVTYWKRPAVPEQMVTTVSAGSVIDETWMPELQEKGVVQAMQVSRDSGINLAAVDFVFSLSHPEPQPLILEINYYFGRRGLGGSLRYYRLLMDAVRGWLEENGFDPERVSLV